MIDNKKTAASGENASDGTTKNGINIIAHALNKGKCAVYLKRDGWITMPQMPGKEGNYEVVRWLPRQDGDVHLYVDVTSVVKTLNGLSFSKLWNCTICWRPTPEIKDWMVEQAREEAKC